MATFLGECHILRARKQDFSAVGGDLAMLHSEASLWQCLWVDNIVEGRSRISVVVYERVDSSS